MNRYDKFFKEFIGFNIKIGKSKKENFIGLDESEILSISNLRGINVDGCFYSYLCVAGKGSSFNYNLLSMKEANDFETRCHFEKDEGNWKDQFNRTILNTDLSKKGDFIMVKEVVSHDVIYFAFLEDLEYCLYAYDIGEKCIDHSLLFVNLLRTSLFNHIVFIDNINKNNGLKMIPWVNYYNSLGTKRRKVIKDSRDSFRLFFKEETDHIMGMDELLNKVIRCQIENGIAPYLPEIYDPYNDFRTFNEYLK